MRESPRPFDASLSLGVRRLAIIERGPAGHQPMAAPDGQSWIGFNGEIYNYVELRDELRAHGMTFFGGSDTEVALGAWRAWGPECFRRFRGMWAMAIIDLVGGRVVLSRDRLGIKPLYLAEFERGYAFASEIKSLLMLPGVSRDVHEPRLRDFLVSGLLDHTRDTLFDAVWAVEPGCWLEIDLRPAALTAHLGRLHRYWPEPEARAADDVEPAEQLRRLLEESVGLHLRSDVPVGSCLSGGLDSSAIVLMLSALASDPSFRRSGAAAGTWSQHTFSAVLPGDPLDESRYVDAVQAAAPGLHDHRVTPDARGLLEGLDALLWHQEEPVGSPSVWMQWEVMRRARQEGVTVLLDGQGGDELFGGYPGCLPVRLADLGRRGHAIRALGEAFHPAWREHYSRGRLLAHTLARILPGGMRDDLRRRRDAAAAGHLDEELLRAAEPVLPAYRQRVPRSGPPPVAPAWLPRGVYPRFAWDLLTRASLPALLHYEDRNSMAFSIEARVPMLDAPLVEFALTLPGGQLLSGGRTKRCLREAMRGRVPAAVLERRDKIGFAAPTAGWMTGPLRAWWRDVLSTRSFRERGCFKARGCARLAERVERGDAAAALTLWRTAVVEQWARRFLDRSEA